MLRLSVEWLERRIVPARPTPGVTNPTPVGLTPAEVRHAYGFDQIPGLAGNYDSAGAGQTIAIVMAGHDPNIASDLPVFSQTSGFPTRFVTQPEQLASGPGR